MDNPQNIIAYANQYGPVSHQHLCDLTKAHPITVRRWLPRLVKSKKLYAAFQGITKPLAYATWNISKRTDLVHDLARADVAVALHNTGLVTYWDQPRYKEPTAKSVNPDARFELTMEFGRELRTLRFSFELDCGTERYSQLQDKFKRYLAAKDNRQVLFVVKSNPAIAHRTKATTLARLAEQYIRKSDKDLHDTFLFADHGEFIANPTGKVCHLPYGSDRYSILDAFLE
jgi:hypothetical protein